MKERKTTESVTWRCTIRIFPIRMGFVYFLDLFMLRNRLLNVKILSEFFFSYKYMKRYFCSHLSTHANGQILWRNFRSSIFPSVIILLCYIWLFYSKDSIFNEKHISTLLFAAFYVKKRSIFSHWIHLRMIYAMAKHIFF